MDYDGIKIWIKISGQVKSIESVKVNHIYQGDALEVLQSLESQQVDMCVTSPPYWGLRDYGVEGQLGLEPDFNEYIDKLCTIFDEVKRVLKDSGTCWVNLGDSYSSTRWSNSPSTTGKSGAYTDIVLDKQHDLPDKCLVGIPFRFALEMINRGWILRNTIIWHKPNCMPSSVKDRFTVDFEYLFFFSKNKKYYFEQQFEKSAGDWTKKGGAILNDTGWHKGAYKSKPTIKDMDKLDGLKRNKRTVWTISTKPYKGAHFAVFPEDLIETPIKAGCPLEICNECGEPRMKIKKIIEGTSAANRNDSHTKYGDLKTETIHRQGMNHKRGNNLIEKRNLKPQKVFVDELRDNFTVEKINKKTTIKKTTIEHWFRYDKSGFSYPTKEEWNEVKSIFNTNLFPELTNIILESDDIIKNSKTVFELSDCGCGAGFHPGTVLDPFMGSGTTAAVAKRLNRNYVGIELNPEYHGLIHERLDKTARIKPLNEYGG